MRICVVGPGAVGGVFAVRLGAAGHEVAVIARGETLAALRAGPFRLDAKDGRLEARLAAFEDPNELGPQDLVILSLKGPALPVLAPRLAPLMGAGTVVLPAMNGVPWWFLLEGAGELPPTRLLSVDPGGVIAAAIPFESVLGCVVHFAASALRPGHAVLSAGNRLILGEPQGKASLRLDMVAAALEGAGFEVERSGRIRHDLWYKLWGNMTMNPISALTGASLDLILDDPLAAAFVLRVMAEAKEVGARIGLPIAEPGEARNAVTRRLGAVKTSMLQDAEAGRPLELDQILAAPLEIAGRLGAPAPNMAALMGLTRLFAQSRGLYPPP